MRALVTQGAGRPLAIDELPDPTPGPGELVLRVRACGICGSDLHLADAFDGAGLVLGHEFAGEVVAIGADVAGDRSHGDWSVGDRVAGFPVVGCGRCGPCLDGWVSKCTEAAQQLGLHRPGAFAEYVTVSSSGAFRLPDRLDDHDGALVEPLAVAHHALDRTVRDPDEPVLVIGGGPVGVAVALWARALGAPDVVVSDPIGHRRALAERAGATATVDPVKEDVGSAFARVTGHAPGVVIECVGMPGMIQHAMDVAATDARVTVVGVCMTEDRVLPLTALFKELTAQFVLYYRTTDFVETIAAIDAGTLDPSVMVTGAVGLDDLPARFESLKHPTTDCKVILEP